MPTIKTSWVDIGYKLDAIKRDFAILCFGFSSDGKIWRGAPQLDALTGDGINAESVVYAWGNFAYALFRRERVDVYQLIKSIRERSDFEDITVQEVEPVSHYTTDDGKIGGLFLARLMLYSLSASRSRLSELQYSNLTGSLLLVPHLEGNPKNSLEIAHVDFERTDRSQAFRIGVRIVTYRKKISVLAEYKGASDKRKEELQHALKNPGYVYHAGRSCLQRWTGEGDPDAKRTYIRCGFKGTHASRSFLDFNSLKHFEKSRAGILHSVMEDIQTQLEPYMTVSFAEQSYQHTMTLDKTLMKSSAKLRNKLEEHQVRIVDRVGTMESQDLVEMLKSTFLEFLPDPDAISIGQDDIQGALNFRIVHQASYYEDEDLKDEYIASENQCQRQHLTIESTSAETLSPVVKTILKEQLIKYDIGQKRFALFDWEGLEFTGQWKFGQYEKDEPLRLMTIEPNGDFDFTEIDVSGLGGHDEAQRYLDAIDDQRVDSLWSVGLRLEGFVVSPEGDINFIYCSEVVSIPNLAKIKAIIVAVETPLPATMRTGNALADVIKTFIEQHGEECPQADQLSSELERYGDEEIPKNAFRKMLNEFVGKNSGLANELRTFLGKEHKVRLIFPKTADSLSELFDSNLNIKYFGVAANHAYYCVGERKANVQYSFKNACHLRKIVAAKGSKLVFDQLLHCMNVDFVRTGQSTVIPVPFKYLREYIDMNKDRQGSDVLEAGKDEIPF